MKLMAMWSCVTILSVMGIYTVTRDQTCESNPDYIFGRWDGTEKETK